jgi:hypothetical protein
MNGIRLGFLFAAVAPTLFGLGGSGLTRLGVIPNLVLVGRYQVDLATLWLVAGLSLRNSLVSRPLLPLSARISSA